MFKKMSQIFTCLLLLSHGAQSKTLCFAHRGGGWGYYDNSISAIKAAIQNEFEGVEIDLHQTKDGKIILLHDHTLKYVAAGRQCPVTIPVSQLNYSEIVSNCKLENGEPIATLLEAFELLKNENTFVILDLKELLRDESIKAILESVVSPERFRVTAFDPRFLRKLDASNILTSDQIYMWNAIRRYENFRNPLFGSTEYNQNLHLFGAILHPIFNSDDHTFGAWEINYPWILKWILRLGPEFIVTKNPKACLEIRDGLTRN